MARGLIMPWSEDDLIRRRDEELEELLVETDDLGPGDWLEDLDTMENGYKGASEE